MLTPETALIEQLRAQCTAQPISFRDYIETVLYTEGCGYYTREAERVGRTSKSDFYTAESLGRVFAELVATAAEDLLGREIARDATFIEIAAEPETSLLSSLPKHPFAEERVIRQGEPITANGPVVIFANEWLDALPFHRLIFRDGQWRERGVTINSKGELEERLLNELSSPVAAISNRLPAHIEDGYELDLPLEAETALAGLIAQDWQGLLLLFDYGRTWQSLLQDHPSGTARTYYQHKQGNDLLARPGLCDITCDINWTPLEAQLREANFQSIHLESQESFLVQRAQRAASAIVSDNAGQFSPDRQTLMELIHPANMGQRFQVLWGLKQA